MAEILVVIGPCVLVTLFVTVLLRRFRPAWPRRRVSLVAAAILPGLAALLGLYVLVDILRTPAERCGVDACAMGMLGVVFLFVTALSGFALGAGLAQALQSVLDRR